MFDAIGLACVQLVVGELEGAYHSGQQALLIGAGLSSTRIRKRYRELAHEIKTHPDSRLADLREQLLIAAA